MTGLEKIIDRILEDAKAEAETIREKAEEEAGAVLRGADESLERLKKEAEEKEELEKKSLRARAESSAALKKRQMILEAKQDMIREQIERAYKSLLNMEEAEYFDLMETMIRRFSLPKEGEICFSEIDLKRLPTGFEERIEKAAEEKGGRLKIRKEPAAVDGGFLLIYGGVEENCSFAALFAAKKDEFSDRIHGLLFGKE